MKELYTHSNISDLRDEYNSLVASNATKILIDNQIEKSLNKSIQGVKIAALRVLSRIDIDKTPDTFVSEKQYSASIKAYDEDTRGHLWNYRALAIRTALLSTLVHKDINKKKLGFRLQRVMENILSVILEGGKNTVSISQIVHRISPILDVKEFIIKDGTKHPTTPWIVDEIALQLVNELAELDYLDIYTVDHIHVVNISEEQDAKLDKDDLFYMSRLAKFLSMKTILTDVPHVSTRLISRRSWWYDTPELSADQIEEIEALNSTQFRFKEGAEDALRQAFRKHLKLREDEKLESWAEYRLAEYRAQIEASNENGGHYVVHNYDSALRSYAQAEIGHFQTSSSLRGLVEVVGISNPVKYDMSNNVIQMYALLLGIKDLGTYVGLVSATEANDDLRNTIANTMNSELGVDVFDKDNIKPLFMIWAYNAGRDRLMNGVYTEEINFFTGAPIRKLQTPGLLAVSGLSDAKTVWEVWSSTLNRLVPSVVALKAVFKKLLKQNPFTETSWTLPDGSIAQYASVETQKETLHWVTSTLKTRTHTHYRKELVANAKSAGVLPRVIHSFDAYVKRQIVIRAHREGIIVVPNHDSFIFDECYTETIFELVATIFKELLNSRAFADVVDELNYNNTTLAIRDQHGDFITPARFGDRLTDADIDAGTPMKPEDM